MRRLRPSHALPLLVPALAAALVGGAVAPAAAQSLPAGSTPDIGSVMGSLGGSVDPSSAAAGSATVGSTGSTGTDSLVGSGTLPPLGTGSQNTSATPPIGMEAEPVSVSEVRRVEIGDPLVAGGDPRFERWWVASESMNRCLLYTSPSPRDQRGSRMPSSA